MDIKEVLLSKAGYRILLSIKDKMFITQVYKESEITYSHVNKIIQIFRRANLIKLEKEGRIKKIWLTSKGNELQKILRDMVSLL